MGFRHKLCFVLTAMGRPGDHPGMARKAAAGPMDAGSDVVATTSTTIFSSSDLIGWEGISWTRQSPSTCWGDIPAWGNFSVAIWKLFQGDNHVFTFWFITVGLDKPAVRMHEGHPMIHMLDKKHKMLVNKKVSNIRKHAKQGAEIPGYYKYLKN